MAGISFFIIMLFLIFIYGINEIDRAIKESEEKSQKSITYSSQHEYQVRIPNISQTKVTPLVDYRKMLNDSMDHYHKIMKEYVDAETSPYTVIEAPALLDVTVPSTEKFHVSCEPVRKEAEELMSWETMNDTNRVSRFAMSVAELGVVWKKSVISAYDIGLHGLSEQDKRRVQPLMDTIRMSTNDNEKQRARQALTSILDKITYQQGAITSGIKGASVLSKNLREIES